MLHKSYGSAVTPFFTAADGQKRETEGIGLASGSVIAFPPSLLIHSHLGGAQHRTNRGRGASSSRMATETFATELLASLAANEDQKSVKFSSREKLAVCKVVEGAVKLSPGRGQRAASLEVVG